MTTYVVLVRGINVGGRNQVPMAALREHPSADVDEVLIGQRAVYHRRVTALATRSRLNKMIGSPVYASLTIRNWATMTKLAAMLDE